MENEVAPYLVLIFPTERDKALAAVATRFQKELTIACTSAPTIVWPCTTAIALLVEGTFERITRALGTAASLDTRYLLTRVDEPYSGAGLSTAFAWLKARTGP